MSLERPNCKYYLSGGNCSNKHVYYNFPFPNWKWLDKILGKPKNTKCIVVVEGHRRYCPWKEGL